MYNVLIMQIVDCQQHLNYESFYSTLCQPEPVLIVQVSLQISFIAKVKKDAESSVVCELLSKTANIGMPNPHEDAGFPKLVIQVTWIRI
jgi:hypothetical protein